MNESEQNILDSIKIWVWSGFYSPDEVHEMMEDILEDDVDGDKMHCAVAPEFEKKTIAESTWPQITDCDRLDKVFSELNDNGIIAMQNAGYTQSDGLSDVSSELAFRDRAKVRGYCFYHGQDLERAVAGGELWLAFGDFEDTPEGAQAIGKFIVEILVKAGFQVNWNGAPGKRINVAKLDWKRRYDNGV